MQMKVPYPNTTEDNTIPQLMSERLDPYYYYLFVILRMFLGEQVCALSVHFSKALYRRLQQMTLVSGHTCSDLHWLHILRSKCGFNHCN